MQIGMIGLGRMARAASSRWSTTRIAHGLMAARAEGFNILRHANAGRGNAAADAETTPLRERALYRDDLNLPEIAELWRRGSVIGSRLLDLTATALAADPAGGAPRPVGTAGRP